MPEFPIRKIVTVIEEICHDGGPPPAQPAAAGRGDGGRGQSLCRPLRGRSAGAPWTI